MFVKENPNRKKKITYEVIMKKGSVLKIDINKEMIAHIRRSNGKYKAALEEQRSRQTKDEKRCAEKKRVNTDLKQATTAKKRSVVNLSSAFSQHESNTHAPEEKLHAT